ncbi:TrkA family potassium uptake protein [Evansella sp. AB-rgal1]|uniref:potassium channel family protein n=1 Tax=Evansella sp. AB-rgal1 TaxID=3242696 RepID=UPI00359E3646
MKKQFAVIGIGRFGGSICRELYLMNHEVLAIDHREEKIKNISPYATHTVVGSGTNEKLLKEVGIRNFEYVIVAIGDNIQASILCTLLLKEFEVKNVLVKAQNDYHHKVLSKIGADRIFQPEKDMGLRVAEFLSSEKVIDYIDLSPEYSILEILATKKVNGQTLVNLDTRAKYGCTILAIIHNKKVDVTPQPTDALQEGDIMVIIGEKRNLRRFQEVEL